MQHTATTFPTWSPSYEAHAFIDIRTALPVLGTTKPLSEARAREITRQDARPRPSPDTLSEREREATEWIARGFTQKEAAYEMGIAASTLRVLLFRAAKKRGGRADWHDRPVG